jgi:ribokinase
MSVPPRVTVLGSMNMDISVTVPRLPQPGATVLGSAARFASGGKGGNQAVAAARLGAQVRMAGCVGDDDFGGRLIGALQAESVDTSAVRTVAEVASGLALITVDPDGENIITVAPGANQSVAGSEVTAASGSPADVLVLSAEIPVAAITAALAQARNSSTVSLLNLAPAPHEAASLLAEGVDWLVVNESEAAAVLGRPVKGLADAQAAAAELAAARPGPGTLTEPPAPPSPEASPVSEPPLAPGMPPASGAGHAVVTAGAEGAAYAGPDGGGVVGGFPVRAVDSVGAGDTFVGALAVALAVGAPPRAAVRAACAAAAVTTTRPGTQEAMPRPADILALTGVPWPPPAR